MTQQFVPPQDIYAEQALLGSVLFGGVKVLDTVEDGAGFQPGFFYREAHETIYRAMQALATDRVPIDAVSLAHQLQKMGKYEQIGGAEYIMTLGDVVPTAANAIHYARMVTTKAIERMAIEAGSEIVGSAYQWQGEPQDLLAYAEERIFSLRNRLRLGESSEELGAGGAIAGALEGMQQEGRGGIYTGFSQLDNVTGGIREGDMWIIAGRTGKGKTSLGLTISHHATLQALASAAYYNFEMKPEDMAQRWLSLIARVDGLKMRKGHHAMTEEEIGRVADAAIKATQIPLHFADTRGCTLEGLKAKIRRRVQQFDTDLFVIDYLGKVRTERVFDELREAREIVDSLKTLALDLRIRILLLAQLNRNVEHRADKTPVISDIYGGTNIESEADAIILLHDRTPDLHPVGEPCPADLIVAKSRHGASEITIPVWHEKPYTRFTEIVRKEEYQYA